MQAHSPLGRTNALMQSPGLRRLPKAIGMTTSSGRALVGIIAEFAEFERKILRDRVPGVLPQETDLDCAWQHVANARPQAR
jgi:hypothetical protein